MWAKNGKESSRYNYYQCPFSMQTHHVHTLYEVTCKLTEHTKFHLKNGDKNLWHNLRMPGVAMETRDTTTCAMAFTAALFDWPTRSPSSVNTGMPCITSLKQWQTIVFSNMLNFSKTCYWRYANNILLWCTLTECNVILQLYFCTGKTLFLHASSC